ncbi:hypothetical protein NQ315_004184 [Exocentrus adspersus]|uniref:Uncharacterized protein n=1 Tax=Exocentrus adspersus TaxID=1586481 RepID=A0AAV8W6L2_9CUCU|nr:hypothetical protein NQ315_004184 [Exocentrus adspersus]
MDSDVVSNCSSASLQSEELGSNLSTLSNLSIYQDEFAELRYLVNPTKYPNITFNRCSTPKPDSGCGSQFDESIALSSGLITASPQLQNLQQIQENYKYDLYNLEKKLELKYYDKIEKLLKTNYQLQSELNDANEQITRLIKNYCSKPSVVSNNFIELENRYHTLTVNYSQLQHKYLGTKTEKEEAEFDIKQLKTELTALKVDVAAKNECINELKDKTAKQYVEIENLIKNNSKASQNSSEITSELAQVRKTQNWYKERLLLCQNENQTLTSEILKCKENLYSQCELIENLNVEVSKWKTKCSEVEIQALKDKESLYKQFQSMNLSDSKHVKQLNIQSKESTKTYEINYYKSCIQDLNYEIGKVKEYVQEQDIIVQKITKENSELVANCITLQNSVRQNEIVIEELENTKKQLTAQVDELTLKAIQKTDDIGIRENQILSLQAELRIRTDEQHVIEQTVNALRQQFAIFKSKYKEVKDELLLKNKQILLLESEKQKLFMDNNWNICELQKLKEKDIVINQLKHDLIKSSKTVDEHLKTVKTMENELEKNHEQNLFALTEKQNTIDTSYLEMQRYEDALAQYKSIVTNNQKDIDNLRTKLNKADAKVNDLEDNIEILKQEVNRRDVDLDKMNNECTKLKEELKYFTERIRTSPELYNNNLQHCADIRCCNAAFLKDIRIEQKAKPGEVDNSNNIIREKIFTTSKFKSRLDLKIKGLQRRVEELSKTSNECYASLNTIFKVIKDGNENENIQKLNVLLQVKELELKEKQKKHEANNRTLLRKVKEHMKGRNAAEKHNKYLQDLYNSLSEENNSLKLELKTKEQDIENLKNILDKFTNVNEKLKSSLLKLEEQTNKNSPCRSCKLSSEKIESLEKGIKDLENEKLVFEKLLMDKQNLIVDLQKENQLLSIKNVSLNKDTEKLVEDLKIALREGNAANLNVNELQNVTKKAESDIDQLKGVLKEEQERLLATSTDNNRLKNSLDEMEAKVEYLSNEVKILSSRLQMKSEEMIQLEAKRSKMEGTWQAKEKDLQNIINTLRHYAHDMQLEINSVNTEKNFLQRLCNDLKLALKSHVSRNKVLKQQLNNISTEKDFSSLPNVIPNIPCDIKYDEDYINQLLELTRAPLRSKPITEMKSCLDTLKREISTLQEQIAQKNLQY